MSRLRHYAPLMLLIAGLSLSWTPTVLASGGAVKSFFTIDPPDGESYSRFSNAIVEIADLDSDGIKEMAVGARTDDNGSVDHDADRGAVWILFMNADGTPKATPPPQKLLAPVPLDKRQFGSQLAWLGNLDPTHQNALAIGSIGTGTEIPGEVQIAFLSYSAGIVSAIYQDSGIPHARCLPTALEPIGDFNGDGVPDLAVGNACVGDIGNLGAVHIVLMGASGTQISITTIDSSAFSPPLDPMDELGTGLAWLDDLDGPGLPPQRLLAAGAAQNGAATKTGFIFMLFLNPDGTLGSYFKIANGIGGLPGGTVSNGDGFGEQLEVLDDLDGDGVPELAVGMSRTPYGLRGSILNLFLNADGTVKDVQRIRDIVDSDLNGFDGCLPCILQTYDGFGVALASVTDRDGDGIRDLATGRSGHHHPEAVIQLMISGGPVQHPAVCQVVCGDKLITPPETCDDGNTIDGDGCSSTCTVEPFYTCDGCPQGPSTCIPFPCGNGVIGSGEECDDANHVDGDGCSSACTIEPGWTCSGQPSECAFCGDGIVEGDEQCDLGPASPESGNCPADADPPTCGACARSCSSTCQLIGRCTGNAACCTTAADCPMDEGCCGNGTVESGELCDDGNTLGGDTCTPACTPDVTYPPIACCPRGSEVAGSTVAANRKLKLTRMDKPGGDQRFNSPGETVLLPGQSIHPCVEDVTYCLESNSGPIYSSHIPGSVFGPKPPCLDAGGRLRAIFKDKTLAVSDPDGLKRVQFKNSSSQPNRIKHQVHGQSVDLSPAIGTTQLRQTLVVGDTCMTSVLTCDAGAKTKKCTPVP